jgi:protein-tyrosine phosphatase
MNYLEININGKGFERSLLWQLSFWSFLKLITLMIFGYRMEAISILGREVMQPRGLIGLGFDSIDHCGPEIADALRAFTTLDNFGILVHCTQGKDRTGLVVALVLFLLDVPIKAISNDYVMSEEELMPERESRMKEIRSIGLTEDFAGCPKDWIERMDEHLSERYGGARMYCRSIGFGDEKVDKLVGILRVQEGSQDVTTIE